MRSRSRAARAKEERQQTTELTAQQTQTGLRRRAGALCTLGCRHTHVPGKFAGVVKDGDAHHTVVARNPLQRLLDV